jgi:hypothetical protein
MPESDHPTTVNYVTLGSGARSWQFVAILGAVRRSSPLPPPWPWSLSYARVNPLRPPPSPPGSGYRPCTDGSSGAAGAILGSPPWWGPWRSPRPPGKPSWPIIGSGQAPGDPCSPASVGSENRFPFFNGKKTGKRGSIVSKPGAPPAECFESWLYLKNRKKTGNERARSSRNRGGAVMVQSGLPPLGILGVRTARETLEGGGGGASRGDHPCRNRSEVRSAVQARRGC